MSAVQTVDNHLEHSVCFQAVIQVAKSSMLFLQILYVFYIVYLLYTVVQ